MKRVEEIMPDDFIRAHRSFMVNWRKISKIEENMLFIGTHRVPLGEAYREALLSRLPLIQ
jgi:DNA-binding LytR/AlgR family response regulator